MPPTAVPVSPLYAPEPPPDPLPLLTWQTEINSTMSTPLLGSEEPQSQRGKYPRHLPVRGLNRVVPYNGIASAPRPRVQFGPSYPARSPPPEDADNSDSELTSISEDDDKPHSKPDFRAVLESEDAGKVPKPEGEAGRPGRGGYSLSDALGWTTDEFSTLQVRTNTLASVLFQPLILFRLGTREHFSHQVSR